MRFRKPRLVIETTEEIIELIKEEARVLNMSYKDLIINIVVREILNRKKLREK